MGLKIMTVGAVRVLSFLDCSLARGEKKRPDFERTVQDKLKMFQDGLKTVRTDATGH